ncbi:PqqD family protein [Desulfobulbus sp.]|uniref:PqqD family protein n=1 Tax=Desulfobulbus sp. TaxID=895 RepID=UPI00286F24A3|nr:PqqD family protein [Desulfobulbus sp.]
MNGDGRRVYLHSLLAGAVAAVDELRGKPHFRLDQLETLPETVLHGMVPVVHRDQRIRIEDGWLLTQERGEADFGRCLRLDARQEYAVNRFDGQHALGGICELLAAEFGISRQTAAATVRQLFVALAQQGICHPAGRPE